MKYKLINIFNFNLWTKQLFDADEFAPHETFALWGRLNGDRLKYDIIAQKYVWVPSLDAMAPWFWDVYEDYPSYRGLMALDPAKLTFDYFEGLGDDFSLTYTKTATYMICKIKVILIPMNLTVGWMLRQICLHCIPN